jgi:acyl-CoA thioesterase I
MPAMSAPSAYYVALGDSMAIDLYPNNDASTRWGITGRGLGAGSLLYKNDPLWPEFDGKDLTTRYPELGLKICAMDGATVDNVLTDQLPAIKGLDVAIATLTVGGNDLLQALWANRSLDTAIAEQGRRIVDLFGVVRQAIPNARLILNTIYDPTDGTGKMPFYPDRLPIEFLQQTNEVIRAAVNRMEGTVLADLHAHFRGHGVTAPEDERWYWRSNIIEPAARGAHEIRRVWWELLDQPAK